jgi:DNA-binding LacI/PurR family transcriptional regulator
MGGSQRADDVGRPTIDQVAARAGVGRGTVSRVVNGSPQVSPRARQAVQRAIRELNYVPNRAARTLVTKRTDAVALVVFESEERVFEEPFFGQIVRAIGAALTETNMQLWLIMAQSSPERRKVEQNLTHQHVDGVLLLSLHDDDTLPALLARRGLPTVLGGRTTEILQRGDDGFTLFVDNDNEGGAQLAVDHLVDRGRRMIGVLAGPQDMGVFVARLRGYRQALRRAGLPADEQLIVCDDFGEASGHAMMHKLLDSQPDIDAVFATSDLIAVGALRALHERGRTVPSDVAVVGFEDSAAAIRTDPPLTTVHQSVEQMGREMVRLLLARIAGQEATSTVLDTYLVVRETA